MRTLTIKDVHFGEGMPKICVPLIGRTEEEILDCSKRLKAAGNFDVAEWRVDHFTGVKETNQVIKIAKELRVILQDKLLLFTFRSLEEGGVQLFTKDAYCTLYRAAITSELFDLVDLELFIGDDVLEELMPLAKRHRVRVVLCHHNFQQTPSQEEIVQCLKAMEKKGADLCKIAVMPQSKRDVLTLLATTDEMNRRPGSAPIISMSMGSLGMISRISGEEFGSVMTFGAYESQSAPGQIPLADLGNLLALFHQYYTHEEH